MQGFDKTYGVGTPFSFHAFNKLPKPDDLIHIYEPLGKDDCEQLGRIVSKAECWVRVSPKVGRAFENMDWLEHLCGCSRLWLDLTEDCKITTSNIESLSKDVKSLLLPYRADATYSTVSFRELSQLESLTISGNFKTLDFLDGLANLHELKLFRVKVRDLESIGKLGALKMLVIERSRLDSLSGIEGAVPLKSLSLLDTRIKGACELSKCAAIEHLELMFVKIGGALELPNSKVKNLRLISIRPTISLESVWAISSLEFLCNDAGHSELQQGFVPTQHKSLKLLYVGPLDRQDAFKLSKVLGVKVAAEESQMPLAFKLC